MTTTQTLELNDNERLTLQKALGIICDIAAIANTSVDKVFEYLCEAAEIKDRVCTIKAVHNIYAVKQGARE